MNLDIKNRKIQLISVILGCLSVYIFIWCYAGNFPWVVNHYNSYVLQAERWLQGRMDLGTNYSHLEIAEYMGKYYVSFPPFPSVLLLPFVLLKIPDGFAALLASIITSIYLFKFFEKFNTGQPVFYTLFVMIASNLLTVSANAWVWFIAQNMSFMFTVMSLYYASDKKGVLSLACWSFAIGCRPFQIVYLPLLLMLLYDGEWKKAIKWFIIPGITAILYMTYNYLRFDSVFEFGHNYLPEFIEAENGQFHPSYIAENLKSLVRLPTWEKGTGFVFPKFNGMSVFLCYPILLLSFYSLKKVKDKTVIVAFLTAMVHIILITAHRTMGGYHFGNRYFADILPAFLYLIMYSLPKNNKKTEVFSVFLFLFGLVLNVWGVINMIVNV